jgi:ribosome-binding protein aMBF1 (putative translation factor)
MPEHSSWREIKKQRGLDPATSSAYRRAQRAFELGESVRTRRERLGLSQSELAERMSTTQSVIARLEAGAVLPTIETLERVAAALEAKLQIELRDNSTGRQRKTAAS